jgi:hypothetical protein
VGRAFGAVIVLTIMYIHREQAVAVQGTVNLLILITLLTIVRRGKV